VDVEQSNCHPPPSVGAVCALAMLAGLASKVARPKARKAAPSFIVETQSNRLYENIDCQEEEYHGAILI
jgi:hypothetical protein